MMEYVSPWDDNEDVWTTPTSTFPEIPRLDESVDKPPLDVFGQDPEDDSETVGTPRASKITLTKIVEKVGTVEWDAESPSDSFDEMDIGAALAKPNPPVQPSLSSIDSFSSTDPSFGATPPMDDFDDVAPSSEAPTTTDDFDDFGDFDEAGGSEGDGADGFGDSWTSTAPSTSFSPPSPIKGFEIPPKPQVDDLAPLIASLFVNLFPPSVARLSDEPERQVEGQAQVLVTEKLRGLWKDLVADGGPSAPVEWKRSRVRRDYLVALGVPVDLSDFLTPAQPLSKLALSLDSSSILPSKGASSSPNSRVASPSGRGLTSSPSTSRISLSSREPTLDRARCLEIAQISESQLSLQSLVALQTLRNELSTQTTTTAELLTYKLQIREKFSSDGETYNAMISDLILAAQKIKTSNSSGVKRHSTTTSRWGLSSQAPSRPATPALSQTNGGRTVSGSGALGASGDPRRFSVR